jgi:hypothetical protein
MSRRKHVAGEPIVRWAVTDQKVMGELTVERIIKLHHFMAFQSDRELLGQRLEAYAAPTDKEPWWVLRAEGGETWRLQLRPGRMGFLYEIWWKDEWRRRQKPPKWVLCLGWSIEYGKRRRWGEDGVEIEELDKTLPERDDEQQLPLF